MESESVGFFLQIETDPTLWTLSSGAADAMAMKLENAVGPLAVAVSGPLNGRLVLSPRAATAWVGGMGGSHPTVARPDGSHPTGPPPHARPVIYLPSTTAATMNSGYPLDSSQTLAELEEQISDAIAHNKRILVKLSDGQLVLNGATLAFAILGQAAL